MSASVKIMLSYDYCHFEVCIGSDNEMTNEQIDNMRKDCQRLADKAVKQYEISKIFAQRKMNLKSEYESLKEQAEQVLSMPENLRTVTEKAVLKAYQDDKWETKISTMYDYEDDFEFEEDNGRPAKD